MAQKILPARKDVPAADTWDLSPLYKTTRAWDRDFKRLQDELGAFERFRGKLGQSEKVLRECFELEVELGKLSERLGMFAHLRTSEDVGDSSAQAMLQKFTWLATQFSERTSFIAPEIQAIPKKKMDRMLAAKELKPFRIQLERLLRYRPHILSQAEERLLAMQGEVAQTPYRVFEQLNDADMRFGHVRNEEGDKVELTQSSFRSLLESPKRSVRREAYDKFYAVYDAHKNTLAASLSGAVLQDVYQARARNHSSALEAALFPDNVPASVYTNLIDTVHANLDAVYRYLELRRKTLRLPQLHMYDTYVPIVKLPKRKTPFEQAVGLVCESLQPLGAAYCSALEKGLRDRWVDKYENRGKRSGAFSSGGYAGPPYILMNYRDDVIDHVFTLAHEAGHSMHTYYSARTQPFQYYEYSLFVAEVASTLNEQLLNRKLMADARDERMRAFLINREIDEIRGTIVRQTMFAEFERNIHALAEAGEPLTLDCLRGEYRKLLEMYFGPDFAFDDSLSLECMRIPHFYYSFYVYKYATGLSAAIALSERIQRGAAERDAYLAFLKSGGSKYPLDLLRDAGVDMEKPEPVAVAMDHFRDLVIELEGLL